MEKILIDGIEYPQAKVRKDLIKRKLKVPVGDDYYGSNKPLPYRWKDGGDEIFQIYLEGKWQDAESIDWEY